jgi:hypothetical protein
MLRTAGTPMTADAAGSGLRPGGLIPGQRQQEASWP